MIQSEFVALPDLLAQPRREQKQLLRTFWLFALGLVGFELFWAHPSSLLTNFGAVLITVSALLPGYLWCSRRAHGLPIFPFFALTYVWTYALPLVTNHPTIITYKPASHLLASVTTSGFLVVGTYVWYRYVKIVPPLPSSYRTLSDRKGDAFFLSVLLLGVLFNVANAAGWLTLGGLFSAIRSAILGLTALATFVLSYRLGAQELSRQKALLCVSLLISYMVTGAVGLLLVVPSSTLIVAAIAFIIGRKKVPFLTLVIAFTCISLLQYGKAEMRVKYWDRPNFHVQPWEYTAWFSEWAGYAINYADTKEKYDRYQAKYGDYIGQAGKEEKASFLERASVMHMLLLAQSKTPASIPYLYGETYAILPQLVVPRIFNATKIRSHQGTHVLSVHYKLQTPEQTIKTTIGWGLLPEAYANFGMLGCGGLAVVLGTVYGKAARWSINAPILSAQSLFSVLMITFAFQTEWTAGVYVAALSQSGVVLIGIVLVLMKSYPVPTISVLSEEELY